MNKKEKKETKMNWIIHYEADYICDACREKHAPFFKPFLCNAHTHGMRETYKHPEFQTVLHIGEYKVAYILNTLCSMVQKGRRFKSGEVVSNVIANYDLQLFETSDNGEKLFRVVIPDAYNHFPDDKDCENYYNLQHLDTEDLYVNKQNVGRIFENNTKGKRIKEELFYEKNQQRNHK